MYHDSGIYVGALVVVALLTGKEGLIEEEISGPITVPSDAGGGACDKGTGGHGEAGAAEGIRTHCCSAPHRGALLHGQRPHDALLQAQAQQAAEDLPEADRRPLQKAQGRQLAIRALCTNGLGFLRAFMVTAFIAKLVCDQE